MRDLLLDTLAAIRDAAVIGAFIATIWLAVAVYIGGA